jgi:hypothetical protein
MDSEKTAAQQLEELIDSSGIMTLENVAEIRLLVSITRAQAILTDAQADFMKSYPDPSEVGAAGALLMLGTHAVNRALLETVGAWFMAMNLGHANLSDDARVDPDVWGSALEEE